MPIRKYKERRNAIAFSSARYRPYSKLSHSLRRLLCSYANCYGDEAVAPSFVRFTELLSSPFHYSVFRFLKLNLRQYVRDVGLIYR